MRETTPFRFFEDSEEDHAKRAVAWLIDKGYINVDFTDPRLSYFTAQIDADLLPAHIDGCTCHPVSLTKRAGDHWDDCPMAAQRDGPKCPECNGERVIRNEWTDEIDRCPSCTQSDGSISRGEA